MKITGFFLIFALGLLFMSGSFAFAGEFSYGRKGAFGDAFLAAKHSQTLNPRARGNRKPVKGLDGNYAASVMKNYLGSCQKSSPSNSVINIGGFVAGGGMK